MKLFDKKGLGCSLTLFGFSAVWVVFGLWVGVMLVLRAGITGWWARDMKKSFSETKSIQNFHEYFTSRHHLIKMKKLSSGVMGSGIERHLTKKGASAAHDFFSADITFGKDKYRLWYTTEFFTIYAREKSGILSVFGFLWVFVGIFIAHLINSRLLFDPLARIAQGKILPEELSRFKNKKCSPFSDVAKALDDARTELALHSRHSTMLLQAAKSISSQMELNHAISMILDLVVEKFPGASGSVVLLDDDGYLRVKNSRGLSADFIKKIRLKRGEGFVGEAIESRKTIIVQDSTSEKCLVAPEVFEAENIKSFIHIPIIVENRAIGVFNVNAPKKNYFTQEIIGVVATLSEYLSIAITNARLYERMKDFNKRLETEVSYTTSELLKTNAKLVRKIRMLRVAMDIFSTLESADGENYSLPSPEIITRIFSRIRDVINVDFGALLIADSLTSPVRDFRLVHRFVGFREPENVFPQSASRYNLEKLQGISSVISATETKPLIKNALRDADEARWGFVPKEIFIKNYMIAPIISHHFNVAVAIFANKMGGESFDDEDIEFMSLICPRVGFYIYCQIFCRRQEPS